MSQAANTFWINRYNSSAKTNVLARRKVRLRRVVDGIVLMIILAASALCVSVYLRTHSELKDAVIKNKTAGERVKELGLEVERLEREVKRLRTDARIIESYARQNLGFIRAGEVVMKIDQEQENLKASTVKTSMANLTPHRARSYTEYSN